VRIVEIALFFSKGLHHRAGIADLGRRLAGQGEAELVKQHGSLKPDDAWGKGAVCEILVRLAKTEQAD
jgi:hypothetical protein